ncbi:MAG: IPT/TIG domain-containing protein, partial [Candidatus Krumholzibacteria bacterium]|nr:IPT/TIG domain-containing protein [Candidatus Krumholzibacteria bacterium]
RLRLETGLSDKFGNGLAGPHVAYFTTQVKPDVGIASLAPSKGPTGSIVVISGFGFESEPSGNAVSFNGVPAVVTEASSTRLLTSVPDGASTGNVAVTNLVEGKTSNSLSFAVLPSEEVARGYDAGICQIGYLPRALAVSPGGGLLFVATSEGYAAVVADPGSAEYLALRHFDVPGGCDGIDVTPDGRRVYAVSAQGGMMYRINGEPGTGGLEDLVILSEIDIGSAPIGVLADPSGQRAFVATADNTVQVWDVSPSSATFDRQIGEIRSAGVSLRGSMAIDPAGDALLVLSGEGRLCVCGIRADTLLASVRVGPEPRDVAVDPTGARAYVTDGNGSVTVVSLEMLQRVIDISAGGALRGCAVTPAGSFLFAVNRELNIYDVIDLRAESRSYRSVVANIPLPVNPVDLEISPDGAYSYAICEQERLLAVTAIGVGPVLRTVSPTAGPVGTTVVLSGSGFADYADLAVSFGGTTAAPALRRESVLVVDVPPGAGDGPVTVSGSNPFSPGAVSNELFFDVLPPASAGSPRNAAQVPVTGLNGAVCAPANGGEFIAVAVAEGPSQALGILDADQGSDTYLTLLGTVALPAGASIDIVLPLPAGDLALLIDRGAGAGGEPGLLPVLDVNSRGGGFLTEAGSVDVSGMTGGVSGGCIDPAGEYLVLVEYGDAGVSTAHLLRFDEPGSGTSVPLGSVPVAGAPIETPRFHPSGMYCYLPVADQAAPAVHVLDMDPDSPTHLSIVGSAALPGAPAGPVPAAIDFNHDGSRCYVLTCDEGGSFRRDLVVLDTSNPALPSVLSAGPLGGSAAGASALDVSPAGDRAIVSIEGEGLLHLDIGAQPDTFSVIGVAGSAGPYAPSAAYSPDASKFFSAAQSAGAMIVHDFSEASALASISGDGQSGVAGAVLQAPLRAKAVSGGGVGVAGVPVTFTVTSGGGSFPAANSAAITVATGESGLAEAQWLLGPDIGTQTVEVASQGLSGSPLLMSATALVDPESMPLQLVDIVPADMTDGVSLSTSTRLVFSRPVDPSTVVSSNCLLREQGASTAVPALIGFSDGNRRVSITPREPLEALTGYDLLVTGGIRDAAGGSLVNPSATVFTTTVPPPLRLDAIQPPSGLRGTNIVLSGEGFDRDPGDNRVLINGVQGAVTEASNDHLVAVVPYDAAAGNVTVQAEVLGQGSNVLLFRVLVAEIGAIDEDVIQKVGTGSTTRSVVVTPDGAMMYAVSPAANSVVVVDIDRFAPVVTIPVGENPFSI